MRHRVIACIAAVICALAHSVSAQPGLTPPSQTPPVVGEPPAPDKSPSTALALALGASAIGYAMMFKAGSIRDDDTAAAVGVSGVALAMVGPSAGHIYAGEYGHAATTTLIRVAGAGLTIWGISEAVAEFDDSTRSHRAGGLAILGGLATITVATVYDIYDAPPAAMRANTRAAAAYHLRFAPLAGRDPRTGSVFGAAVSGRF